MRKIKAKLKLITPLINSGANKDKKDKKDKKEFRVTELKALLRTTFRELYYFKDENDMRNKENFLFGSTEKKSPVSIICRDIKCKGKGTANLLPHKGGKLNPYCFGIGSEIEVLLMERYSNHDNDFLKFYIDLLFQASIVGGLGKRSRKGLGAFKVIEIKDFNEKNNEFDIDNDHFKQLTLNNLHKKIETTFQNSEIEEITLKYKETKIFSGKEYIEPQIDREQANGNYKMDSCYPYLKKINIIHLNRDKTIKKLLKEISQLTHDRLFSIEKNRKGLLNEGELKKVNVSILGQYKPRKNKIKRFPSPVYITFAEDRKEDKYLVIKELNYNYELKKILENKKYKKELNEKYVNEFVKRLEEIGGVKK